MSITRRDLLKASLAAPALSLPLLVPSWAKGEAPSEKLNIAAIGVGGRGRADLDGCAHEKIVALCDADSAILAGAAQTYTGAKTYADFRVMFDEMEGDIDAVVVGTPDHTHAAPGCAALVRKKHLYCEKPLAHDVYEVRTMTELTKKNGLVTQLGTQIHADNNYRRVVELVQSGAIGAVRTVDVWFPGSYAGGKPSTDKPPIPDNLDWDLWLGPALYRPYHPQYVPFKWRYWRDFGSGTFGDFFCHYCDLPYWALNLGHCVAVEGTGEYSDPASAATWAIAKYEFPARGDLPPVTLTWYDGGKQPAILKEIQGPGENGAWPANGVLFSGEKGYLWSDYGNHVLLPKEDFADFQPPAPSIPASIGHHREWTEACKTGGPTTCHFAYSGPLSEGALLGVVATRIPAGRYEWDAANLKVVGCDEAEPWIRYPRRPGWELES